MNIFGFDDCREVIAEKVKQGPRAGRGEYAKIARAVGLHTTTLSQIQKGLKSMAPEHGILVCDYFGFDEAESQFFLALIHLDRAGTDRLRKSLKKQIEILRREGRSLRKVVPTEAKLSLEQKAQFYSHWHYSAIRVLSSIPEFQTPEVLASRLGLEVRVVRERLKFLIQAGLCKERRGHVEPGPKYTHLESDSPLIAQHHANWRLRGLDRHSSLSDSELAYTSPMSLSARDAARIRQKLVDMIKEVNQIRDPSPCEVSFFLGLDWCRF